jgi:hypothetical protein
MPGWTTTAVVLMWVMVAISSLSALFVIPVVVFLPDAFDLMFDMMGPDAALLVTVTAAQALAWAGIRAYLAVKIARRSASARTAALVVEPAGMVFQLVMAILLFNATMANVPDGMNYSFNFDCTGIVLPVLVICFLATARSRQWCDR